MKKILMLLTLGIILLNAADSSYGYDKYSTYERKGESYIVQDKPYVVRCIEGYKWLQFLRYENGMKREYFPDGNPQQMFVKNTNGVSAPLTCDK